MARTDTKDHAVLTSLMTLSTNVAEQTLGVGFGFVDDVITEARKCAGQALDLLEGVTQSAFRVARGTTGRVGDLFSDTVANSLASGRSLVRLLALGGDHMTTLAGAALARQEAETPMPRGAASRPVTA